MKKRCFILCLVAFILLSFAAPASAAEYYTTADTPYYTVLVLDTSGSHSFNSNGTRIYTADTAISYVKEAAGDFSKALLGLGGNHYVAVISYKGSATTVTNFTNDPNKVLNGIQSLSSSGSNCSVSAGLIAANNLLSSVTDATAEKNVVLFTTGYTNAGDHSYSGIYNNSTPGSSWYKDNNGNGKQDSNDYKLYSYANVAYQKALTLHKQANIYTVGLFQNWDGMPAKGQELVSFFKQFTRDLAMPVENYKPVYDKKDLNDAFGHVCNGIIGNPFNDVTYNGYYFNAVLWAEEKGITVGTSTNSFDPNAICTREQMVTFLWRAAGSPAPKSTSSPFNDIKSSDYSYKAILWAAENGITVGTSATTFSPKAIVTREQVVTFLWRVSGSPLVGEVSAWGNWSEWSTSAPTANESRQIETRNTVTGYNLVVYVTQDTAGNRNFRSYSVNGNYDAYGLNAKYGENFYSRTCSKAELDAAPRYNPGDVIAQDDSHVGGIQKGDGQSYYFNDGYGWFIASEIKSTEYRYRDATATSYKTSFTDIKPTDYSYNAILWAQKTGITVGMTNTTFAPKNPCTRGQIVTFLYRYYN